MNLVRKALMKPETWGVILAAVTALIYWLQLREMISQTKISREGTQAYQRAFMYMDDFSITKVIDPSNPKEVAAILVAGSMRNSGVTPAIHGKYYINSRLDAPPEKADYLADFGTSEGFYPPQASEITNAASFPITTINQIQFENRKLFVFGWIKYRDVFAGTAPHITKFCDQIVFDQTPTLPAGMGQVHWVPCGENNCTDDQCQAN